MFKFFIGRITGSDKFPTEVKIFIEIDILQIGCRSMKVSKSGTNCLQNGYYLCNDSEGRVDGLLFSF